MNNYLYTNNNQNNQYNQKIPTYAQYGSDLVTADNLALLRGAGAFNPPSTYEQSTDRGSNYTKALDVYEWNQMQNIQDQGQGQDPFKTSKKQAFGSVIYETDIDNKRKYDVGVTGFHPEPNNSWSTGPDKYVQWAMTSMRITNSALLNFFFSTANVDYLQQRLIDEVKRIKNVTIQKQSTDELLIIMQNKYLYGIQGYLNHPGGNFVHNRGPVSQNGLAYTPNGLSSQVSLLNKSVLEETVKSVLSGISAYTQYYKDASSMPMPLSLPVISTQKGSKALQENLAFESSEDVSRAMSSYNERFNII